MIGGDFVVHSRNGQFKAVSGNQAMALNLTSRRKLATDDAIVIAGLVFGADFAGVPDSTAVIYARGPGPARLAWRVRLQNDRADMTYIVGDRDGQILDRWSNRETIAATGTGRTLYSGDVALTTNSITGGFELRDPSRGGMHTIDASNTRTSGQIYKDGDNIWGNYALTDQATAAADAQYGASVTWDYYKNVLGRVGIANDGKGAYSRVCTTGAGTTTPTGWMRVSA